MKKSLLFSLSICLGQFFVFSVLLFPLPLFATGNIDSALVIVERELGKTGGKECVIEGIERLVEISNDVEVVGAGSFIKGTYKPGSSDHDFTLRLLGNVDNNTALRKWRESRNILRKNVRNETRRIFEKKLFQKLKEFNIVGSQAEKIIKRWRPRINKKASALAQDFLSRTNLYPPDQLMSGVKNAEDAVRKFKNLGLTPAVKYPPGHKYSAKDFTDASDGIWGEEGKAFRQGYERKTGKVWYKKVVTNADGTISTRVISAQGTDLLHEIDGHGLYTIKNTASISRQQINLAEKALNAAEPDFRVVMKDAERAHLSLKKSRDLSSISNPGRTPLASFYDDFHRIQKKVKIKYANLSPIQQAEMFNKEINKLCSSPTYCKKLRNALYRADQQAAMLDLLAESRKPMRKAVIRNILEGNTKSARKLSTELLKAGRKIPVMPLMIGLFTYWDTINIANKAGDDYEAAVRKAMETLSMNCLGLGASSLAVLVNAIIDSAKEAGFMLATAGQDCQDLIAGIISVKGWEDVSEQPSPWETTIEQLAVDFGEVERLKRFVDMVIYNASSSSHDTKKIKEKKKEALRKRCMPQLIKDWRNARTTLFMDFLKTVRRIDEVMKHIRLVVEVDPDPVQLLTRKDGSKIAEVVLVARLKGPVNELTQLLRQAEQQIRKLGTRRFGNKKSFRGLSLRNFYQITWKGLPLPDRGDEKIFCTTWPEELERLKILVDTPKKIKFSCDVKLKMRHIDTRLKESGDKYGPSSVWSELLSELSGSRDAPIRGDVVATHGHKGWRIYSLQTEGVVDIEDSGISDELEVEIMGEREILAGERTVLQAKLKSGFAVDPADVKFLWDGVGRKKNTSDYAFFTAKKPGRYRVSVKAVVSSKLFGKQKVESVPLSINVLDPQQARFRLAIQGTKKNRWGESVFLKAEPIAKQGNTAAVLRLRDPDIYIRWLMGGKVIDTGTSLEFETTAAGDYPIRAELVDKGGKKRKILASAEWLVVATERGGIPVKETGGAGAAKKPRVDKKLQQRQEKTSGNVNKQKRQLSNIRVKTDPSSSEEMFSDKKKTKKQKKSGLTKSSAQIHAGSVFYGETLKVDLSKGYNIISEERRKSAKETDKRFFELQRKAMQELAEEYEKQKVPAKLDINISEEDSETNKIDFDVNPSAKEEQPGEPYREPDNPYSAENIGSEPEPEPEPALPVLPQEEIIKEKEEEREAPLVEERLLPPKFSFIFHASPSVPFAVPENNSGKTTALINRIKEVAIWAQVIDLDDITAEVGETAQYIYKVKLPAFSLKIDPKQPVAGQEVRITVVGQPKVPAKLVNYVWYSPSSKFVDSANGSDIRFTPVPGKETKIQVEARTPRGETLGVAVGLIKPQAVKVSVSQPTPMGPIPQRWDPVKKELVDIPKGIATFQNVTVKGSAKPADSSYRYSWKGSNGLSLHGTTGREVTCHATSPGTYTLTLVVIDKNNKELGRGSTSFTVTTKREDVSLGKLLAQKQRKADKLVLQAKSEWRLKRYDKAQKILEQALELVEDHQEGVTLQKDWQAFLKARQDNYRSLIAQGEAFEKAKKYSQALHSFSEALKLKSSSEIQKRINSLQKKINEKKRREAEFAALLNKAEKAEKAKHYQKAIDFYQQALKLKSDPALQETIARLKKRAEEEKKKKSVAALLKQAKAKEDAGKYKDAISLLDKALKIEKTREIKEKKAALLAKIAKEKQRKKEKRAAKQFSSLLEKGFDKEKQGKMQEAVDIYRQALKIKDDAKVRERIKKIIAEQQAEKKRQQERREKEKKKERAAKQFSSLLEKGFNKEKQGKMREAVDIYRQALKIKDDAKVRERIKKIIAEQQAEKKRQQERREKEKKRREAQRNNALWTGRFATRITGGGEDITLSLILQQHGNKVQGKSIIRSQRGYNDTSHLSCKISGKNCISVHIDGDLVNGELVMKNGGKNIIGVFDGERTNFSRQ